ncbi:MAG: PAS domain-containing protein [Rhodospirillales bacterium]
MKAQESNSLPLSLFAALSRPPPAAWAAGVCVLAAAALAAWRYQAPWLAGALVVLAGASSLGAYKSISRMGRDGYIASLLLAATEESPKARLITDAAGGFVYANPSFHRLFAMAVSLDAISGIVEGPESADDFRRLVASARAGVPAEAEIALRLPPDITEWLRISVQPLPGRRGYVMWRAEDITADREMGAVRRREEDMLADFFDYLPVGFFSVDAEGRFISANRTLGEWLGVDADELRFQGHLFSDFVVAEESAPPPGRADNPGTFGEVTLRATDGRTFRAALAQSEKVDDEGAMVYSRSVLLRNLSWRDGGESSSQGLVQRLHWLFDEAPVGVVLLDLGGNVADCNRAFLKLLGLHREAVKGHPLTEFVNREDRADVGAQLSKVVMGAVRAAHLEVRMPGAGQGELAASIYASRIEDAAGEVSGLILHFIDTTEKKHLEVQFTQSQKMQAVGQLAGGVAHDFNNLLTAMIGFCDLLLERHDLADPSFSDIMQIKQNANRATNLVRQLLAFSRKQTLKPETIDPNEAISELSHLLGRLIGENIELVIEAGHDLGYIFVDRGQFDQVIINLVVNGRDAMPGGGALTIRTGALSLTEPMHRGAGLVAAGEYVLVEVTDTGQGIARENIEHIFEPFFSTKEVGEGTGLGLSTVYGIIHQTGGHIFVDSALGEGATFSIYLPRYAEGDALLLAKTDMETGEPQERPAPKPATDDADHPADNPADNPTEDLTGTGTVLLVEDEDAVRMFATRALTSKGYHVLEAGDGEEALDVINGADEAIDLIISDVVMPGMDGHTLIQLVRQEFPQVRVILMSGYAENVVAAEIERDPTIHFLAKPFSLKDLAGKVKEVMEESVV